MYVIAWLCLISYVENTEVVSPPPYPSRLPSYDEILQLSPPMQSQLYYGQVV